MAAPEQLSKPGEHYISETGQVYIATSPDETAPTMLVIHQWGCDKKGSCHMCAELKAFTYGWKRISRGLI